MVGQVVRSFEEYKYLKEAYDTEKIGKLKSITMERISGDVKWGFEDWFHNEERVVPLCWIFTCMILIFCVICWVSRTASR